MTGLQTESVAADLWCIFCQKAIKPGLQKAIPEVNKKFKEYFDVKEVNSEDSKANTDRKRLYFCHKLPEFLAAVDRDRGRGGGPGNSSGSRYRPGLH